MVLWKVCISGREWRGGDYNGGYYGFYREKYFSTKEKAIQFMKDYKNPEKYGTPHNVTGPYEDKTHVD